MKAIVHIGTEKTGTTSIQNLLYSNREKLIKSGFHFIQSAGEKNNRALPAYCMEDSQYDDFFNDKEIFSLEGKNEFKNSFISSFRNELESLPDSIHTVIISSEHFHSRIRTKEEIANVYELLSTYFDSIKIVCYIRDQVKACTSRYSTGVRVGGTRSFGDFLRRCIPDNYYYNYHKMLSNWEETFGFDSLDVSIFDPHCFLNKDLLDDFTAKIDPKLVGKLNKDDLTENESLNISGQILGRAVNKAFPRSSEFSGMRNRCQKIVENKLKGRGEQPSLDIQKSIHDAFSECNERVRQKYFPELKVLFNPPVNEVVSNAAIDEHFVAALSDIFSVIDKDGKGIISPDEYAGICIHILSSVFSVTRENNEVNREIVLSEEYADVFRDSALKIEKTDFKSAFTLMNLAYKLRPSGPRIKKKMEEYRQIEGRLNDSVVPE